jgi:DNA-binding NarL/FixJ family response regulator
MPTAISDPIRVLIADSNQMQRQLLVSALRRRPEFQISACGLEADAILGAVSSADVKVVIMNVDHPRDGRQDLPVVRRIHLSYPAVAKVLLLDAYDRDLVINAFRSGAKGLFCFPDYPFRLLCKCIQSVHRGEIWANSEQLHFLIEGIRQVPSLRVVNANGSKLLTPREEQVVALVADGLPNRQIAKELNLSEHTVKKYLFRIFDKLGISSRVELVLYAVSYASQRVAEWVPGGSS